jgi:hypothetical protein
MDDVRAGQLHASSIPASAGTCEGELVQSDAAARAPLDRSCLHPRHPGSTACRPTRVARHQGGGGGGRHFGDPRWLGPHSGELTVKIGWRPDGMAWREKNLSEWHTGASKLFNGTQVSTIFYNGIQVKASGVLQRSGDATTWWLRLPSSLGDESGPVSPWWWVWGAGGLFAGGYLTICHS